MRFYLGTHMPHWLERTSVPLFVSHRRLQDRRGLPRAVGRWALDSGGFTELSMFGEWRTPRWEYVASVRRYSDEIGHLDWASPQDWMCEPWILAKTGLTVAEHQQRTIENYLALRYDAPELPFVPVLQGWVLDDYRRHADAYTRAGVDLQAEPTVGIGSVCRRQSSAAIDNIVWTLATEGLKLHGFGVKTEGLASYGQLLASADSMAWSFGGRRVRPPICGSTTHATEANCLTYALSWRRRAIEAADMSQQLVFGSVA